MESLNKKRILVTGGAGFVGSNLVRTLVNQHLARVIVLDNLFTGNLDYLEGIDCEFVLGSVEDSAIVNECVKHADIVFHLASRNIVVSNQNPREDLNVNVKGSFNVFEACVHHSVERVVYTSTSSVYGEPGKIPISENDRKSYLNFYSASKFSAEVYAHSFFEVFHLPVCILRYSNVYGVNQLPVNPYCGVIGKFIQAATAGQPLKVHGNGKQTRDYTYVEDAVEGTIAAALYPEAIGEDYNLGTGQETSVIDLAKYILDLAGSNSEIQYIENRDIDNISRRKIDFNKAHANLHYSPKFSIREGLSKTINWFLGSYQTAAFGVIVATGIL